MRERKFRAWNKEKKKMFYVDGKYIRDLRLILTFINQKEWRITIDDVEDFLACARDSILMEWTGRKDKNGKDIYEGDIVSEIIGNKEYLKKSNTVVWNKSKRTFVLDVWEISLKMELNYEIIGNIYENPELVKESKL